MNKLMQIIFATAVMTVIFFMANTSTFAFGVRPLSINADLQPGDSQTFEIMLTPGNQGEFVRASIYTPIQRLDGSLQYEEQVNGSNNAWVHLDQDQFIIKPGKDVKLIGKIIVPFTARGSHTDVVMVKPEIDEHKPGINFVVRYAIHVNINVDRPGVRESADVAELKLDSKPRELPNIQFKLINNSLLRYAASAEATIRDEKNRLVERVKLLTPDALRSSQDSTKIMPGAEVIYSGKLSQPLFPGEYNMRLFVRYGDCQLVQNKTVVIDEQDVSFVEKPQYVKLGSNSVRAKLVPGGAGSQVIQISNNSPEELTLKVAPRDIERDYPNSVFSKASVKMRTDPEFALAPRSQNRMVVSVQAPRDLAPGGYFGYLDVGIFAGDELLEKHQINISLVTLGEVHYCADLVSLAFDSSEKDQLFSVDVKNLSNGAIVPEGTLCLKDKSGIILQTLHLSLPEEIESVLPRRSERITAATADLLPGQYTAEVKLRNNLEEIAVEEFSIDIK